MAYTEGQTATNPSTGEKLIYRGGAWQPAGGSPGILASPPVTPKPVDPLDATLKGIQIGKGQADLNNAPYDTTKAAADARAAVANADKAEAEAARGPVRSATEIEAEAKKAGEGKRAATVNTIMGQVERLYKRDIEGQPFSRAFGATEYIDSLPANETFTAAANAMLPLIRPLIAQTAKEGDSDKEMQVFQAYIPNSDDSDSAIEEKLNMMRVLLGGMVDGKPASQMEKEIWGAQAGAKTGDNFDVGGAKYRVGANPVAPPPDGRGSFAAGIGDAVETVGDTLGLVANPANALTNELLGTNLTTDLGQYLREASGLPQGDPMASAINKGGFGAMVMSGGASAIRGAPAAAESVLSALRDSPIRQTIGGMSAGGASEFSRQQGDNALLQGAAGLAGGIAGYGGASALAGFAGRTRAPVNALAQAASRQGVDLLPADVGGPMTRRLTSAAAQAPLSATPVIEAGKRAQGQIAAASNRAATSQGAVLSPDEAGQAVRKAGELYIKGETQRISAMYDRAGEAAKGVKIKPLSALAEIDSQIASLGELEGTNAPLIKTLQTLRNDIAGGVSVAGLRRARTALSEGVYDGKLRSNQEQKIFRDVLDTLSTDIEAGLQSVGKGGAAIAFKRADSLWRERIGQIDEVLEPIIGKSKSGEDVLAGVEAMTRGQKGGVSRLGRLLKNMPDQQAGEIRATLIDRLGMASAGQQDDAGKAFSAATWLTNWNRMSPRAKMIMFGSDNTLRRDLDDIAKIASANKEASRYANHSNSAGGVVGNLAAGGLATIVNAKLALVGLATQYIGGRALASPALARWLAKAPEELTPGYISRLGAIASKDPIIANGAQGLQGRLMEAMNDNIPRAGSVVASPNQGPEQEKKR